mgnify:FL=1
MLVIALLYAVYQDSHDISRSIYTLLATPFLPIIAIVYIFTKWIDNKAKKRMQSKYGYSEAHWFGSDVLKENLYVKARKRQNYYTVTIGDSYYKARQSYLRKIEFALFGRVFGKTLDKQ